MSTLYEDVQSLKKALRQQMRAQRLAFPAEKREAASEKICIRALEVLRSREAGSAAIFLATSNEPEIDALGEMLRERDWKISAPYFPDMNHCFHEIEPQMKNVVEVRLGNLRLRAPAEYSGGTTCDADALDVIFVPGLAFDEEGMRLGQGGGWYDRVLADASQLLKIGVAFDFQLVADLPCEAHDQTMDFVITEKRVIETRK